MKQSSIVASVFIIIVALTFTAFFLLRGNEDSWLCQNGSWVRHGNPAGQPPASGCGINPISDISPSPVFGDVKTSVTEALSLKYSRPVSEITVTVTADTGTHAKGMVNFAGESGGLWFAALTDGGWQLAADGNGMIPCSDIDPYSFPSDMIPSCLDENQEVVQR